MIISVLKDLGYTKVTQLYGVIPCQEDIGALDVSVEHLSAMNVF